MFKCCEIQVEEESKKLIQRIDALLASEAEKKKLEVLYNCLDVLDSKASSLLTFNGLLTAIFAFLPEDALDPVTSFNALQKLCVGLGLFLTLASAGLCLWVARIAWRFFERIGEPGALNVCNELGHLAKAVERRTLRYRFAWRLSCLAIGLLVVAVFSPASSLVISALIW